MQHNLTILSDNHFDEEAFAQSLRKRRRWGESGIELLLLACGLLSIGTTLGIVYVLFKDALEFFASPEVTLFKFLTGTVWQPQIGEFGVLPLLTATIMITIIAMLIAVPNLSPFGRGNPQPTFLTRHVDVVECRNFGNQGEWLRLKLRQGNVTWQAVDFESHKKPQEVSSPIDIVYNLEKSRWSGEEVLRLNLLDSAPAQAG